jgi:hypothetical protein
VSLTLSLSTMTREQYVERKQYVDGSKERARALLRAGRRREAVASMMMDMRKCPNWGVPLPHAVHAIGILAAAADDAAVTRAYIEGFY